MLQNKRKFYLINRKIRLHQKLWLLSLKSLKSTYSFKNIKYVLYAKDINLIISATNLSCASWKYTEIIYSWLIPNKLTQTLFTVIEQKNIHTAGHQTHFVRGRSDHWDILVDSCCHSTFLYPLYRLTYNVLTHIFYKRIICPVRTFSELSSVVTLPQVLAAAAILGLNCLFWQRAECVLWALICFKYGRSCCNEA